MGPGEVGGGAGRVMQTLHELVPLAVVLTALSAALPRLWAQRRVAGATSLAILAAVVLAWALSDGVQAVDPGLRGAVRTSLLMWVVAPAAWFAFGLEWSGRRELLLRPAMGVVWLLMAASAALVLMSPGEGGLLRLPGPDGAGLRGPWVRYQEWVGWAALAGGLLVVAAHIGAAHRGRGRLLFVAGIIVAVGVVEGLGLGGPGPQLPASAWSVVLAVATLGLLDSGAQDLAPVARSLVVEELRDVVLVLDRRGRIADLNRAAAERLGLSRFGPLPTDLGAYWAGHRPGSPGAEPAPPREHMVLRDADGEERIFELSLVQLQRGGDAGRAVLTLRDVTEAQQLARELRARTAQLSVANAELAHVNQRLERLANTDALTGLANRRRFMERLDDEVERANRYRRPLSLLCLDLDHFKQVNDTCGHPTGDEVLRRVGGILHELGRDTDLPARLGGEEFAVLLPETDVEGAVSLAERIRRRVAAEEVEVDEGEALRVTVSVGVASMGGGIRDPESLLQAGDRALYRAKAMGRNRVSLREQPV